MKPIPLRAPPRRNVALPVLAALAAALAVPATAVELSRPEPSTLVQRRQQEALDEQSRRVELQWLKDELLAGHVSAAEAAGRARAIRQRRGP